MIRAKLFANNTVVTGGVELLTEWHAATSVYQNKLDEAWAEELRQQETAALDADATDHSAEHIAANANADSSVAPHLGLGPLGPSIANVPKPLPKGFTEHEPWLWLDIDRHPVKEGRALLRNEFSISPLVLDDMHRKRHPPKLEQTPECWFLMVRGLDATTTDIDFDTIQLSFLVGDNFLVTSRDELSVSIDKIWDNWSDSDNRRMLKVQDALHAEEYLTYRILRVVTDRFQPLLSTLEERLESIEDDMFNDPNDKLLAELMNYSRQLKKLRRICRYHETHLRRLLQPASEPYLQHTVHEYTDIYENQERLASSAQLHLEITNDLVNGYLSLSAHRLNQVMRVLTVVTVIFVPLTFIAGIYGMNFNAEISAWNMPELSFKYGYPIALGFMLLTAIVLIFVFRRRKWL